MIVSVNTFSYWTVGKHEYRFASGGTVYCNETCGLAVISGNDLLVPSHHWQVTASHMKIGDRAFSYLRLTELQRNELLWSDHRYLGVGQNVISRYHILGHYSDIIMGAMASQITSLTIVYSTVYSGADHRKHQSSASLAFVRGIHRRPVNSPHKWPVTRKMFPFDDVIMRGTDTPVAGGQWR